MVRSPSRLPLFKFWKKRPQVFFYFELDWCFVHARYPSSPITDSVAQDKRCTLTLNTSDVLSLLLLKFRKAEPIFSNQIDILSPPI